MRWGQAKPFSCSYRRRRCRRPRTEPRLPFVLTPASFQNLAKKNAGPRGVADGAVLPLQPFFWRLIVDSPIAGALDDGGKCGAPHRLDAVEVKFERPLHRPVDSQSPFSRIEIGRGEMVSYEEQVGWDQPIPRAKQTEIPCSAGISVERSDLAVVAPAWSSHFRFNNSPADLETRRAPIRSHRSRHASIAFRFRLRSSAYHAFEG